MNPKCIQAVIQAVGRQLTKAEIDGIEQRLVRHMRGLAKADPVAWTGKSNADRLQEAAEGAAQELIGEAQVKQKRLALTIVAHDRIGSYISDQAARGINAFDSLDRTIASHADLKSNFLSVEAQSNAVSARALSQMLDTLTASNPKWFGLYENAEGVQAIIKEIFGEDSGNADAKGGAKVWKETTAALRERFNRAGGDIGELDDWGMPHHHSQVRVAKAGRDQWVADVMPFIDRQHYHNSDGSLMNAAQLGDFLGNAWTTIATGGANKMEPGQFTGSGSRANRGNASRQIHFKDAQSYMDYEASYGERSLYEVLTGHVEGISKDIALVETFGPNPDHTFRYFRDKAAIDAKLTDPTKVGKIDERVVRSDNLYNVVSGKTAPVASEWLANSFDTLRNWLIAARLGSSVITSFSDDATMHLTAKLNHLPEMRLIANELSTFNPANRMEERMAQRAGLGLRTMISSLNRYGQQGLGASFSKKLANTVLRVSGLNAKTEAQRRAFGVTMMGSLGGVTQDHAKLSDIDAADHRVLLSKGITDTDFQVWKKAQLEDWGGGNDTMLTPESIYRIPDAAIDTVIAPKIQSLKDEAQSHIDDLKTRDTQDQQWVQKRSANLSKWLADAQTKVQQRIDAATGDGKAQLQALQHSLMGMGDRIDTARSFYREANRNQATLGDLRKLAKTEGRSEATRAEVNRMLKAVAREAQSIKTELGASFEAKWAEKEQQLMQRLDRGELSDAELQPAFDRFTELFTEANARLTDRSLKIDASTTKRLDAGKKRIAALQGKLDDIDDAWTQAAKSRPTISDVRRQAVREGRSEQAATQLRADVRDVQRQLEAHKTGLLEDLHGKFQERRDELKEFSDRAEDRGRRRAKVIDRIIRDIDPAIANARTQAREQAATKLLAHTLEETDIAVIEPGAKERAMTGAGIPRGTWKGELTRSFFLFKSFPLAMIARHWDRGMSLPNAGGKAAYLATLIAATTVLGAASLEVNEVLSGRDPRNLNPAEKGGARNWIQAMLKGGSLGIYGDFLFSDATQHGQSPVASFMGPVIGTGEDIFNLTQGNVMQTMQGKPAYFKAELVKFARSNTPGASLWYAKAALDHLIFHQLQEYFSPGYLATMRSRAEREFGQKYYWEPGQVAPDRAPNLGAAVGE